LTLTKLRVGQSLASIVDGTKVVIIRTPDRELSLTCGGTEMQDAATIGERSSAPVAEADTEPTAMGKRYVDPSETLEVLCTSPGQGRLAVDGEPLVMKSAKPLPASD
jgi:hypothetical protein